LDGAEDMRINWSSLMAFKKSFTDPVPANRLVEYRERGIDAFHGHGRFIGQQAVMVGDKRLEARYILIATGDKPADVPINGAELLKTSDDFLALPRLPRRIIFVGGGYISFELAHIACRAGAEVTILHADDNPLAQFDQDLVGKLVAHSRRLGIEIALGAKASHVMKSREALIVETDDGRRFEADLAVHGLGRVPNLGGLNLAAGDVAEENGKLVLDRYLRSVSNPAVFAAGDVAGNGPALTPIATHDAECVAANLLGRCEHEPDYEGFATNVFAIPPLAMTGLTEASAKEKGLAYDLRHGDLGTFQSVRREGEAESGATYKVLIERESGKILGAHIYGPQAHETINLFAFSIRLKLHLSDLRKLLSAYPSSASDISNMLG
jgi:glutathione reductase (NADPH)